MVLHRSLCVTILLSLPLPHPLKGLLAILFAAMENVKQSFNKAAEKLRHLNDMNAHRAPSLTRPDKQVPSHYGQGKTKKHGPGPTRDSQSKDNCPSTRQDSPCNTAPKPRSTSHLLTSPYTRRAWNPEAAPIPLTSLNSKGIAFFWQGVAVRSHTPF